VLPVGHPSHPSDGQRCPSQRDSQDGCPTLGTPFRLELVPKALDNWKAFRCAPAVKISCFQWDETGKDARLNMTAKMAVLLSAHPARIGAEGTRQLVARGSGETATPEIAVSQIMLCCRYNIIRLLRCRRPSNQFWCPFRTQFGIECLFLGHGFAFVPGC